MKISSAARHWKTQRAKPLKKMMAGFTTDREDIVLVGRETILRDGKFAGYLTSGGYGYTLGNPSAMAICATPKVSPKIGHAVDHMNSSWRRSE